MKCPKCDGKGVNAMGGACSACHGNGKIDDEMREARCSACGGLKPSVAMKRLMENEGTKKFDYLLTAEDLTNIGVVIKEATMAVAKHHKATGKSITISQFLLTMTRKYLKGEVLFP